MKKTKKTRAAQITPVVGFIAILAVIGFMFIACDEDKGDGEKLLTISGAFGGAVIGGEKCPVIIRVRFEYDEMEVKLGKNETNWSIEHYTFKDAQPLWFEVDILAAGDDEQGNTENKIITYQYDIKKQIKNSNITGIALPAINITNTIKLSGTVSTELNGNWMNNNYWSKIQVVKSGVQGNPNITNPLDKTWKSATGFIMNDGTWEVIIPSSSTDTGITFSVQLGYSEKESEAKPYGIWAMGKINKLNAMDVKDTDVSDIALGNQKFVVLSGDTPVIVNGKRPLLYRFEFGYYSGQNSNGWSGTTQFLYEGSAWSIPMPADIYLEPSITFYEKDRRQFRFHRGISNTFQTGNEAKNVDLGSHSF